jgi:hypothetical protein
LYLFFYTGNVVWLEKVSAVRALLKLSHAATEAELNEASMGSDFPQENSAARKSGGLTIHCIYSFLSVVELLY